MKKIVDIYGEEYIKSILNDREKLEKIYDIAYQAREGINDANQEIDNIQIAIDDYVMNQILSKSMKENELENYKNAFNKTIRQDMTYIFRNPVLRLPKEKLTLVMSENTYDALQQRKNAIAKKSKEIFQKGKEKVTKEEREFLLDYLSSNIGTRDKEIVKMQDKMMHDIITEEGSYGYKDINFITQFIADQELKEYGIEGYCHLSKYKVGTSSKLESNTKGVAISLRATINQEYGLQAINEKENIGMFIHTICHEVRHINQRDSIEKGVRNEETLQCLTDIVLRNYLTTDRYDYYKTNYYFESGEINAELAGYSHAVKYLRKYATTAQIQELLVKKDEQIYKKIVEMRKDSNQKIERTEDFKHREMGKIVKNHPEILNRYPQLQSIYKSDGNIKSLEQILIEKGSFNKRNKQDNANIYTSTINTLIDNNELEKIDFSTLSRKNIYSIMHALSDQYNYYATSSHNYSSAKSKGNNYISNPNVTEQELNNNIDLMKTRFEKIENILDPLYDNFSDEYKQNPNYKQDHFLYQRDRLYARYQFHKIKSKNEEINEMFAEKSEVNEAQPTVKK